MFIEIPFMFLSDGLSLSQQIMGYKSMFLYFFLFTLWNIRIESVEISRLNSLFVICVFLLCLYGAFSYATSTNIYAEWTMPLYSADTVYDVQASIGAIEEERGILKGRITGTASHTIQYAILMGITAFYLLGIRKFFNKKIVLFLIIFCFLNMYLTGSRGPLFGAILGMLIYIVKNLSVRQKIFLVGIVLILFYGFNSLFSLASHEGGSSLDSRMIQIYGCWLEINKQWRTVLFGLGRGYNTYYLTNYGVHPLALGFEGRFLAGLVNYGIIGMLFVNIGTWIMELRVVQKAYKMKRISADDKYCLLSLVVFEITYSVVDGTAYTLYFFVAFVLILKYSMLLVECQSKNVFQLKDVNVN